MKNFTFQLIFAFASILSSNVALSSPPMTGTQLEEVDRITSVFAEAYKIAYANSLQQLGDDHLDRLQEYLDNFFPLYFDKYTMHISRKDAHPDTNTRVGIGVHLTVCPEFKKKCEERLSAIREQYLTEEGRNPIYKEQIDRFLKGINPEYRRISDALIVYKNVLTDRGMHIKEIQCDSPAERGGLTRDYNGWYIVNIDDIEVPGLSLIKAAEMIDGKENTVLTITVRSPDGFTTKTFTIKRDKIAVPLIESRIISGTDPPIGYIKLIEFNVSGAEFIKKVEELENSGAKALILDLTNDVGGNMRSVVEIASLFLKPGVPLCYVKRRNEQYGYYRSHGPKLYVCPLSIILNGESASASEILSGALKEYGLATLIGTRTFGKGLAQRTYRLSDQSILSVTIEEIYSPIQKIPYEGVGISPDIEIEDDPATEEDEPLLKAVEVLQKTLVYIKP